MVGGLSVSEFTGIGSRGIAYFGLDGRRLYA